MNSFIKDYNTLKSLYRDDDIKDISRVEQLLENLKIFIYETELNLSLKDRKDFDLSVKFRSVFEYELIYSVKIKNFERFVRTMNQLKPFYFKFKSLPKSQNMLKFLSIYLVFLLSQGNLSGFYIELQNISDEYRNDVFIKYAIDLCNAFNENSIKKLLNLRERPPSPLFKEFISSLFIYIRNKSADSFERAYSDLSVDEIQYLLYFDKKEDMIEFLKKRQWVLSNDKKHVIFNRSVEKAGTVGFTKKSVEKYVGLACKILLTS